MLMTNTHLGLMLRLVLVLTCLTVLWLVVLLPVKLVTSLMGGPLATGDSFGSVWDGRIFNAYIAGDTVDRIQVQLDPLALFSGQAAGHVAISDSQMRGDAYMSLSGSQVRAQDLDLRVDLGRLSITDLPGINPQDPVYVRIQSLVLDEGDCVEASGLVQSGALVPVGQLYGVVAPEIEGYLACHEGRPAIDLAGNTPDMSFEGRVVFDAAGYNWTLTVETQRADLAEALALMGFSQTSGGWQHVGQTPYPR